VLVQSGPSLDLTGDLAVYPKLLEVHDCIGFKMTGVSF
jgi:hypothetical protein